MAQYLILIYEDEAAYSTATPEVMQEVFDAHTAFMSGVDGLGAKLLGGNALRDTGTATSVRAGGAEVTDGPFVETKEFLGGLTIVNVADEDAARMWAGKIAEACGWPQEVRRFKPWSATQ